MISKIDQLHDCLYQFNTKKYRELIKDKVFWKIVLLHGAIVPIEKSKSDEQNFLKQIYADWREVLSL